jgi:hypothetical protein
MVGDTEPVNLSLLLRIMYASVCIAQLRRTRGNA